MPGGGTDDKPAKAGDTGTAKGKVKTDYQRLARSTIETQFLSLVSPKTQSKS